MCVCVSIYECRHRGPAKIQIFSNSHSPNCALLSRQEHISESFVKLLWFPQTRFSDENFHCRNPLVRCCSNIRKSKLRR